MEVHRGFVAEGSAGLTNNFEQVGTTQAAMDVFAKGKFEQLMKEALSAAKQRAKELAK